MIHLMEASATIGVASIRASGRPARFEMFEPIAACCCEADISQIDGVHDNSYMLGTQSQ
jgi:hypothetical protein